MIDLTLECGLKLDLPLAFCYITPKGQETLTNFEDGVAYYENSNYDW